MWRIAGLVLVTWLVVVMAYGLAGCATAPSAPPALSTACLPLAGYSAAQQTALADAIDTLPAGSPLREAMRDYGAMRAADRACMGAGN